MLKVIGSMQRLELAQDEESLVHLRASAEKAGLKGLDLEAGGNMLYGRSIFMGYDLPNDNGDAIPGFYSHDFGPSFISKKVDHEHLEDPDNEIGRIVATWHMERDFPASKGPRVIGRNAFGHDMDGRPQIFRMAASRDATMQAALRELLLAGIWGVDRSKRVGDIVARRLISGELNSVSQEASTSHALCSVCGHKVVFPFDPVCEHLVKGSMMVRAWKVSGYADEMLGYKVHQNPVGTGLGIARIPALRQGPAPTRSARP